MRLVIAAAATIAAFSAAPTLAAPASTDPGPAPECNDSPNQLEMNTCTAQAFKREDALLNQVYAAYRAKLEPDRRAALTVAQKSWLAFRDTECKFEEDNYAGGSIQPAIWSTCLAGLTQERRKALAALLEDASH